MQRFLTKNILSVHLALLGLVVFCNLFRAPWAGGLASIFFSVVALEYLFLFPAIRRGENFATARSRTASGVRGDALFYIGLAFLLICLSQVLNGGVRMVYDVAANLWEMSRPNVAGIPFATGRGVAFSGLCLALSALVAAIAIRNGTGRKGKTLVLGLLALFSGIAATVFLAASSQAPEGGIAKSFASSRGYFFAFWSIVATGLYFDLQANVQNSRPLVAFFLVAVLANFSAAMDVLNAAWAVVFVVLEVLAILWGFLLTSSQVSPGRRFGMFGTTAASAAIFVFVFAFFHSEGNFAKNVQFLKNGEWSEAIEKQAEMNSARRGAAFAVWEKHPWWGTGIGGYKDFSGFEISGKKWAFMKPEPENAYNDYAQLLCEYGLLGTSLVLAAAIALAVPFMYRFRLVLAAYSERPSAGSQRKKKDSSILWEISPMALTGAGAAVAIAVAAWFANPFRCPGMMFSWCALLAALPAFLPERGR